MIYIALVLKSIKLIERSSVPDLLCILLCIHLFELKCAIHPAIVYFIKKCIRFIVICKYRDLMELKLAELSVVSIYR